MKEKKEKLSFFQEFKNFISRGNIVDMAVGIIIGSAFTAIVNSLVKDIITPLIGVFSQNGEVSGLYFGIIENGLAATDITLQNGAIIAAGEMTYRTYIYYGSFIQTVINFLVIAFSVFCMVKVINKLHASVEDAKEKIKEEIEERKEAKENKEEKEEKEERKEAKENKEEKEEVEAK